MAHTDHYGSPKVNGRVTQKFKAKHKPLPPQKNNKKSPLKNKRLKGLFDLFFITGPPMQVMNLVFGMNQEIHLMRDEDIVVKQWNSLTAEACCKKSLIRKNIQPHK